ncbi:MAG: tetraacyldisaccharide 4'-kinase [Comamonadaceae bacterium]|nr:tetraacyldisaccharide 4'-kinase [Burkholderiales bacterium]MEB2348153.1 tetraacyldisaccharide 4'-kinase [Comamonadaceae bacterium]
MSARVRRSWQRRGAPAWLLWPLSVLYGALVAVRRALYHHGVLRGERLPVPVIVVGNVVAGGAGKTPVTLALLAHLQRQGWHPAVISRGYGRRTTDGRAVRPDSGAREVGDEPLLIARRGGVPVFVDRDRARAGRALLAAHPEVDIVVCDDGLQHLALARDLELCVFNEQGVGNGWLLPAGPLREPWPRAVDAVLYQGDAPRAGAAPTFALTRALADEALDATGQTTPLTALGAAPLVALAGTARPEEFFAMLRARGLHPAREVALPDHYDFDGWKRPPDKRERIICTEKDAVKLWPRHPDVLAVALQVRIAPAFYRWLDTRLASLSSTSAGEPHGPETA